MKLLTKAEVVADAPRRWKSQYFHGGQWTYTIGGKTDVVHEKLLASQPLTAEKVNEIIGNDTWTEVRCGECKKDKDAIVIFDVASEYSLYLCFDCLAKASALNPEHRA